jgi:hypothetical protein
MTATIIKINMKIDIFPCLQNYHSKEGQNEGLEL